MVVHIIMTKPNEQCPCKSGKKYKKCCRPKGTYAKAKRINLRSPPTWPDQPEKWPNYGVVDPTLRFSVGQRVECFIGGNTGTEKRRFLHQESKPKKANKEWIPGVVMILHSQQQAHPDSDDATTMVAYVVRPDSFKAKMLMIRDDTAQQIRPLGMEKSRKPTCSNCQTDDVKLFTCGACLRAKYCGKKCMKADRDFHRSICEAIVTERKRLSVEAKRITAAATTSKELSDALYSAALNGDTKIVKRLLKKKDGCFDINSYNGDSFALLVACERGNTAAVDLLLQANGIKVNQPSLKDGATPLYAACESVRPSIVTLLLKKDGVNINSLTRVFLEEEDQTFYTPLYVACQRPSVERPNLHIITLLLSAKDIDVNLGCPKTGSSPLWFACSNGTTAVVDLLLQHSDIDVNQLKTDTKLNCHGATPLYVACQNNHPSVVSLLLKRNDIQVNKQENACGRTPLMRACINNHHEQKNIAVIKLLLKNNGIDVNLGFTCGDAFGIGINPFWNACENGNTVLVKLLLKAKNIDVNPSTTDGCTALYVAVEHDQTAVVKILLKVKNIDVNRALDNPSDGCHGATPLWKACANGQASMVAMFLKVKGIDVNKACHGISPLKVAQKFVENPKMKSLYKKHDKIIQLLTSCGLSAK